MVADAIVYHPSVAHYLKFVATTIGRDKLFRLFQYFSRFYSWYLYRKNGTPSEIAPYNAIKSQFGLIRKSLRLGKFVEHFKAAAQAYDTTPYTPAKAGGLDPFLRYCAIGRQLGYAGYMAFDNVHFLHAAGVRKLEWGKWWQEVAWRFWGVGLWFNVCAGLYQIRQVRNRQQRLDLKEGEGVVEMKRLEKDRKKANLQLVSDLCDLTVPAFGLGYTTFLDDGLVGLAGSVSSLIGIYTVWQNTA